MSNCLFKKLRKECIHPMHGSDTPAPDAYNNIMSAIWGIIDLDRKEITADEMEKMTQPYREKAIDRIETFTRDGIFMACGIQYVTPEARYEKAVYTEDGATRYLSGDILLDNRSELIGKYQLAETKPAKDESAKGEPANNEPKKTESVSSTQSKNKAGKNESAKIKDTAPLSDGYILSACYFKDPETAIHDLLGAYVFVDYDQDTHTVRIINDISSNRSLYYSLVGNRLYYSTLIEPLAEASGNHKRNKKAILDFLSNESFDSYSDLRYTLYENIYLLAANEIVTVSANKLTRTFYWHPETDIKVTAGKGDDYYKERFIAVLQECVSSYLRTVDETAILLSGGLDSTAVGAMAAPLLEARGRKLYSYTWVPSAGFDEEKFAVDVYFPNERKLVNLFCDRYTNIIPEFVTNNGKDLWTERFELMHVMEAPYKSIQNLNWIYHAYQDAAKKNCRILLTGQCGNTTFSSGDILTLLNTMLLHGHLRRMAATIKEYSRVHHCGRRFLYRALLDQMKERKSSPRRFYKDSFIKKDKLKQYKLYKLIMKDNAFEIPKYSTVSFHRSFMNNRAMHRHMCEGETKFSLETGVISRDPTRDKRLITLLLSYPYTQFVDATYQRRLIRLYLKDYIPHEILDTQTKGMQSSDLVYLMHSIWKGLAEELKTTVSDPAFSDLIKKDKLLSYIDDIDPEANPDFSLYMKIYTALYYGMACDYLKLKKTPVTDKAVRKID